MNDLTEPQHDQANSEISGPVRDLLAAVVDALDVPLPGLGDGDERAFNRLMERRRSLVHSTLASILRHPTGGITPSDAEHLRAGVESQPITYTPWDPATVTGGEVPSC